MANYFYVDTASSGGDGTTRGHSGSTAAFASLDAAFSLSLTAGTVIRCAGSTADTTATSTGGVTTNGYPLTIAADKGEDDSGDGGDDGAGYDDDGFNDTEFIWSTAHYRLDQSSAFTTLGVGNDGVILDGLQIGCGRVSAGSVTVSVSRHGNGVKNCRIKAEYGTAVRLNSSSFNDYPGFVHNNLVFTDSGSPATGIDCGRLSSAPNATTSVCNNVVVGFPTGIHVSNDNTGDTWEIHNNVVLNATTEYLISTTNATVNATFNAGEGSAPSGHDSDWVTLSATITDDLVDPENATYTSRNFTPVEGGGLDGAGLGNDDESSVFTTDLYGNPRDGSAPDIGAIELQSGSSTQTLTPTLFTNAAGFFAVTLALGAVTLTPPLFANTNTFYPATLTQQGGTQTLTPSRFDNANAFYSTTLAASISLTPPLFANTNTFYSATLATSVSLTPSRFDNANTFYSATLVTGAVTLTPSLFENTNTFYPATLAQQGGTQTLTPSRFDNANAFYSVTLATGAVALTPSLFENTNTFYLVTLTQSSGGQTLTPSIFENTNTFYSATLAAGAVTLTPSIFENTNTFYGTTLTASVTLTPSIFVNTNTFYSTILATGAVTLTPSLFANTNTFYPVTLTGGGTVFVPPSRILSVQEREGRILLIQRRTI